MANKLRNLRFTSAARIEKSYRDLPALLKVGDVREIASAFVGNMDRILAMVEFAPLALGLALEHTHDVQVEDARRDSPQRAFLAPAFFGPPGIGGHFHREPKLSARWSQSPLPDDLRNEAIERGHRSLADWMKFHPKDVAAGIEAVLSAQIIGAWSAFETLAGDLWETIILNEPKTFAALKQKSHGIAKAKTPLSKSDEVDILRDEVSFNSPWGTRAAYKKLGNAGAILRGLSSKRIDALNIIRNVIAHHAGKIDKRYFDRAASVRFAPKLKRGRKFPLTGEVCSTRINAVIARALSLVHQVDKRLGR
ncbi:MAG TPA: hypothetical protein VK797_28755 [Tepidisphaeraceae bacterium]|nr:hypothetical protein [Tepidisphaeraceae bacterium]